jgi:quercetin dioxygenase-like cupin family protein
VHTVGTRYVERGDEYLQNLDSCPHFADLKQAFTAFKAEDFKLNREKSFFFNKESQVTVMDIIKEENYNMRAFFYTAGKSLPIHDHPGIMAIGNVLQGKAVSLSLNTMDPSKQDRFHKMFDEGKENLPENIEELRDGIDVEDLGTTELVKGGGFFVSPKDVKHLHDLKITEDMILLHVEMPSKGHYYYMYSEMEGGSEGGKIKRLRMEGKLPPFPEANFKYEDYKEK